MNKTSAIEALESRIAPAAVLTFTDVDGDTVTVKTSLGTNAELAPLVKTENVGMGVAIQEIDLSLAWTVFEGTDLSVVVTKKGEAGDGLVNVRYIDGEGLADGHELNLGRITIDGDLGKLDAGRGDGLAVKSLKAATFGLVDAAKYDFNTLPSYLKGGIESVSIAGIMACVNLNFTDAQTFKVGEMYNAAIKGTGDVGTVTVVGDIERAGISADTFGSVKVSNLIGYVGIGATGRMEKLTVSGITGEYVSFGGGSIGKLVLKKAFFGEINAGFLGSVSVNGDFQGILQAATLGSLKVNGMLTGTKAETGYVTVSGNVTSISVRGDVLGGLAEETGYIEVGGSVGSIRIGGSMKGISALGAESPAEVDDCGSIQIQGNLDRLFIGGDLVGTTILAPLHKSDSTGSVIVQGNLGKAVIGGSILAGAELQPGLQASGTIQVGKNLGSLLVKGDVRGNINNLAIISALGADGTPDTLAIGKVTVGGDVKDATIRAGDSASEILNSSESRDESIGVVQIGGDFMRSSVLAGQSGMINAPELTARIARIVIGGSATGGDMNMSYGFLAEEIGSLRLAGKNIALKAGKLNDLKIALDPEGNTILAEKLG